MTSIDIINHIEKCTCKTQLLSLYTIIKSNITSFNNIELICIEDCVAYKQHLLNMKLESQMRETISLAQYWESLKEYDVGTVYIEMAEEYKRIYKINII